MNKNTEEYSEALTADSTTLLTAGGTWLEALYEKWLHTPKQIPTQWHAMFEAELASEERNQKQSGKRPISHQSSLTKMRSTARLGGAYKRPNTNNHEPCDKFPVEYPSRAIYLIHAWRVHGHAQANLDPLKINPPHPRPELELSYYGLSDADLDHTFPTGDMSSEDGLPLRDILARLKRTYAGSIGPELMHISDSSKKHWLFERLESMQGTQHKNIETQKHTFQHIMHADAFEHFLHTRYMGQKRFSLEGGESLIPMLDHLIQRSGVLGVKEIILGMAHRGRLNVLANILGKSLTDIFAEFEGTQLQDEVQTGSGDVKYHLGFSSDIETPGGVVHLSLGFNPSHLEIITPVVLGSVRARQCRRKDKARRQVLGVIVHGDAAFAGQGVVAESLNLGELSGFRTGGTIHIVVNNQIGFTTNTYDSRSTLYCTDIAKMVQA
ncbi:MAG: thiamine pyrophosphate-dependent enzyme, partial [Mariprofundaceae bacterium]|nr:thiamine pyrophosphate-dependent enzyme [Mariprofundaceae bacterium]